MNTAEKLKSLAIDRSSSESRDAGPWPLIAGAAIVAFVLLGSWVLFFSPQPEPAPIAQAQGSSGVSATSSAGVAGAAPSARARGGLVASGYVVARRSATVSTDFTGRLQSVLFEEGAVVEEGQLLGKLDDELAAYDLKLSKDRLRAARANVEALQAQLVEAEAQLQRSSALRASEAISAAAMENAEATTGRLRAQLEAARADVQVAAGTVERQEEFLDRHNVRAPFAGVIVAKNAQAGEIISPAAGGGEFTRTGVATLVDMDSLEVEVDVNEGQIADVYPGQEAVIVLDSYSDWEIPGEVIAIIPTANRSSATIKVRVGFKVRDQRILPEMAAKVTFDRTEPT